MEDKDLFKNLHLDASGRAVLSDDALDKMDLTMDIVSAGGDPETNEWFCYFHNRDCNNSGWCSDSSNDVCHNTEDCSGTTNTSCGRPGSTTEPGPGPA